MKRTIAALTLTVLVAGCSRISEQGNAPGTRHLHPWSQPGVLRVAIQRSPNTLNPLLSGYTIEGFVNRLSFDVLVTVSSDGKTFLPSLAREVPTTANGGVSKDGLDITYHLRSDVKWQDGAPFTSKDVKFSWQAMMNDANNVNTRVGYEEIARVDTPDAATVVFHLKRKFAPFVATVFSESDNPVCIVPEHILGKYPNINRVPFNSLPIGTGPFRVTKWVRGDHIELVANPTYFQGPPKLHEIIVREIPDENTSINALRSHEIDWMFEPSPNLYNVLKTLPDIAIHLNDSPQDLDMLFNLKHPPLDDLRVRQAIAYAIDKASLVQKFTGGSASVAGADQTPSSWSYEPDVIRYPTSVAKARALLAQAGYTLGPDGIMQKDGKPLSLDLATNVENATRRLVEAQVQAMLRTAGIDAEIKNYPGNLYFATYGQGGIQAAGKYDLAIRGWIAGSDPDDHSLYRCDQIPPSGVNYSRYCSLAMDAAQAAALGTYDQAKRKLAYATIQKLIAHDLPEFYFWYTRFPQATNPDLRGFAPNPVNEAWNSYQWEI